MVQTAFMHLWILYATGIMQTIQPLLRSLEVDLTPINCTECDVLELVAMARRGDHIAVRSVNKNKPDVIWHHGIFINFRKIIHMHPDGNISAVAIQAFVRHAVGESGSYADRAAIINYVADSDIARSATCDRALSATVDEFMQSIVYNGLKDNCECFAVWCRTGRQVTPPCIGCFLHDIQVQPLKHYYNKLAHSGGSLVK